MPICCCNVSTGKRRGGLQFSDPVAWIDAGCLLPTIMDDDDCDWGGGVGCGVLRVITIVQKIAEIVG